MSEDETATLIIWRIKAEDETFYMIVPKHHHAVMKEAQRGEPVFQVILDGERIGRMWPIPHFTGLARAIFRPPEAKKFTFQIPTGYHTLCIDLAYRWSDKYITRSEEMGFNVEPGETITFSCKYTQEEETEGFFDEIIHGKFKHSIYLQREN